MAKKQIIMEVVEKPRGVDGAKRKYPDNDHTTPEGWAKVEEVMYEVTRLVNTVDYQIGDLIEKEEMRDLIARVDWKIVVTKPKK